MLGHVADIRDVWRAAHIAVLPSRREGLPLCLLGAAVCGWPIVATDVPDCREIAREGINALEALAAHGLFDAEYLRQRWQEHLSGRRDWQHALWTVLQFQAWHRGQS